MFEEKEKIEQRYQLERQLQIPSSDRQTWLATDLKSQQQVRLRMLALSPGTRAKQLKLFQEKARILRTPEHPQIPKYQDYFALDIYVGGGVVWFVLVQEYIQGYSLLELLEQAQKFSEKQLLSFTLQILDVLTYLHELNPVVLHLAIEPSNLILGNDNKIYLIGNGTIEAVAAAKGLCFNTIAGKGCYTPLEQFLGKPVPASDLYSLGATLIHVLTGITPADLPQSGSHIEFVSKVNLDKNFVKWLEQITDVNPNQRFQTAIEAKEVLLSKKKSASIESEIQKITPRIKVNKTDRVLTIDIPNSHVIGWQDYAVWLVLVSLKLIIFKQVFIWKMEVNYSVWLTSLGTILAIYVIVLVFEGTKISLSSEELSVKKHLFGIIYSQKKFQYSQILKFDIEPYQEVLPGLVRAYKKITINTKDGVYELGKIPETEREWFLDEIKIWWSKSSFQKENSSVLPHN